MNWDGFHKSNHMYGPRNLFTLWMLGKEDEVDAIIAIEKETKLLSITNKIECYSYTGE